MYLLKDAWNEDNFNIDDVYKEENEILEYNSDIDRDEIDVIHYMCAVAKEIKDIYKDGGGFSYGQSMEEWCSD